MTQQLELIATTSFGLEAVVARELKALGYEDQTVEDGRVSFRADKAAICRANLWLRSAGRVLVKLGEFDADDFGQLFDETVAIPWQEWLPEDACFPVAGKSIRSQLQSVPHCQSIVKKAIVERLTKAYGRTWFEETGPTYAVEVSLLKDRATLTLDTSGTGLHRRGYRKLRGEAPLRETTAAALVQLSYWNAQRPFVDPFCGSGTIAIEAALLGRNMAPGLNRTFAAETWPQIPPQLWDEAREEARQLVKGSPEYRLIGTDCDARVLDIARINAENAGVGNDIHFQQKDIKDFTTKRYYGCLICNPPYGERMGEQSEAAKIAGMLREVLSPLETWSIYVLMSDPNFEREFGKRANRRRKLYNGRIECTYYQYLGPRPPRRHTNEDSSETGDELAD